MKATGSDAEISDKPASRTAVESLVDFVRKYAANGNEVAIRHRRGYRMETWSYARIVQGANRLARELEFHGIGKGDAVLLWGENSPEWIMVFFGCLLRGAVIVPVDHGSTVEFASRIAREVNAKLIFRARALPDPDLPIRLVVLDSVPELTADARLLALPCAFALTQRHTGNNFYFRHHVRTPRRGDLSWQRARQHRATRTRNPEISSLRAHLSSFALPESASPESCVWSNAGDIHSAFFGRHGSFYRFSEAFRDCRRDSA